MKRKTSKPQKSKRRRFGTRLRDQICSRANIKQVGEAVQKILLFVFRYALVEVVRKLMN